MDEIYTLAFKLHDLLLDSKEYLKLKEKEKLMLDDKKTNKLIQKYHELEVLYNENKSSNNLTLLHQIKLELDLNPLVKDYQKAYKEYQILIGQITDLVFLDFKNDTLIDKILKKV